MDFRHSQFFTAIKLLAIPFVGGGMGYYILGLLNPDVSWSIFDCFYMNTITLTTVGFGETLPGMENYTLARAYTMVLLVFGTGFLVYAASTGTAFIIEGELGTYLERRRMQRDIAALNGHYIVCGAGTTGTNVVRELMDTSTPFVVVEIDDRRVERLKQLGVRYVVHGDATTDEALLQAGILAARGLASCLSDDKDNLFVTVTARQLNQRLRIVAKNVERHARDKLINAGATVTVSPTLIGGLRLASELIRPAVVTFLDVMLRTQGNVRFAEVTIRPGSSLDGKMLRDANLRQRVGLSVFALKVPDEDGFRYNPGPDEALTGGTTMIVIGAVAQVQELEKLASR
jgi:voltage-gated potassium channel